VRLYHDVLDGQEATIVNPSECRTAYGQDSITNNMLCARSTPSNGACQLQDGSPLAVSNQRGGYVQAGIVSRTNPSTGLINRNADGDRVNSVPACLRRPSIRAWPTMSIGWRRRLEWISARTSGRA
jgi:hypothetical protein